MNSSHHYLTSFLLLATITGSMVLFDYNNESFPPLPLQASILSAPEQPPPTNPQDISLVSSFQQITTPKEPEPPKALIPTISSSLFTLNTPSIENISIANNFVKLITPNESILPILRYTLHLTNLEFDPKYINVYEIQTGSPSQAYEQHQLLLQLAVLQANNRYSINPTSNTEFYLQETSAKDPRTFLITQIGSTVYGFHYHPALNTVVLPLTQKLKAL